MTYSMLVDEAYAALKGTAIDCISIGAKNYSDDAADPTMVSIFAGSNEGYFVAVSDRNGEPIYNVRTHGSKADALEILTILFTLINNSSRRV